MIKLIAIVSLALPFALTLDCAVSDKIDCGYYGINSSLCAERGCCWSEVGENGSNIPWCYYPAGHEACYDLNLNASGPGFTDLEFWEMVRYFEKNLNIDGKGGVVASP